MPEKIPNNGSRPISTNSNTGAKKPPSIKRTTNEDLDSKAVVPKTDSVTSDNEGKAAKAPEVKPENAENAKNTTDIKFGYDNNETEKAQNTKKQEANLKTKKSKVSDEQISTLAEAADLDESKTADLKKLIFAKLETFDNKAEASKYIIGLYKELSRKGLFDIPEKLEGFKKDFYAQNKQVKTQKTKNEEKNTQTEAKVESNKTNKSQLRTTNNNIDQEAEAKLLNAFNKFNESVDGFYEAGADKAKLKGEAQSALAEFSQYFKTLSKEEKNAVVNDTKSVINILKELPKFPDNAKKLLDSDEAKVAVYKLLKNKGIDPNNLNEENLNEIRSVLSFVTGETIKSSIVTGGNSDLIDPEKSVGENTREIFGEEAAEKYIGDNTLDFFDKIKAKDLGKVELSLADYVRLVQKKITADQLFEEKISALPLEQANYFRQTAEELKIEETRRLTDEQTRETRAVEERKAEVKAVETKVTAAKQEKAKQEDVINKIRNSVSAKLPNGIGAVSVEKLVSIVLQGGSISPGTLKWAGASEKDIASVDSFVKGFYTEVKNMLEKSFSKDFLVEEFPAMFKAEEELIETDRLAGPAIPSNKKSAAQQKRVTKSAPPKTRAQQFKPIRKIRANSSPISSNA